MRLVDRTALSGGVDSAAHSQIRRTANGVWQNGAYSSQWSQRNSSRSLATYASSGSLAQDTLTKPRVPDDSASTGALASAENAPAPHGRTAPRPTGGSLRLRPTGGWRRAVREPSRRAAWAPPTLRGSLHGRCPLAVITHARWNQRSINRRWNTRSVVSDIDFDDTHILPYRSARCGLPGLTGWVPTRQGCRPQFCWNLMGRT